MGSKLHGGAGALVLGLLVLLCGGCGGSDDNGNMQPIDVTAQAQVVLGYLGGANVQVFGYGDFTTALATTTTSDGASLAEVGRFSVLLQGILPSDLFLFVVSGGEAFDADGDGVLDGTPSANLGTAHCVISGAQLIAGAFLISILTEAVYQRARYFLGALYPEAYLLVALSAWATFLLATSTDGDADVDADDALMFDPQTDQGRVIRPYAGFRAVAADLVDGNPITRSALALSEPQISFLDLGTTRGVDVAGTRAYVCQGNDGLGIYDISDPTAPSLLGTYNTPGFARTVRVVGTLAYVADEGGGLQIVDVSSPGGPTMAGAVPMPGVATDVRVQGTRAYVADNDSTTPQIHVVDISNAATASILGSENVTEADAIEVSGTRAFVAGDGMLEAFDVSVSSTPTSLGAVAMQDNFVKLAVSGTSLFSNGFGGLEIFDISGAGAPSADAFLELPNASGGVAAFDGRVALGRAFNGLAIVDVQAPTNPRLLGYSSVSGGADAVAVGNGVFVTTETNGGLQVLAQGSPPPEAAVATLDVNRQVRAVSASGNTAAICGVAAGGVQELILADVSDPVRPVQRGTADLNGTAEDIVIRGNLAFVGHGFGLEVVDISNLDAPFVAGGDATITGLLGLALDTNVLYGGAGSRGLEVIDITTPTAPSSSTVIDPGGTARGVAYDGSVVTLCVGFPGIVTFDATTPSAPTQQGTFDTSGATDVVALPGIVFVADFSGNGKDGSLDIVDTSTVATPVSITSVPILGNPDGIALAGDHAFLKTDVALEVVDVSVPADATHIATLPLFSQFGLQDVDASGNDVYVAAGDRGLKIVPQVQRTVP